MALLCLNFGANGQAVYILKGRVLDGKGQPLPNVTLKIAAQNVGTTDKEGHFNIQTYIPKGSLVCSAVGYTTKNLAFQGGASNLMIILGEETTELNEVEINAGYYTVKEKLLTGNITTIRAEDIGRQPVSNVLSALQGRVPGMVVTQTSGVAGASFNVQIRGQNALDLSLSKNNPLFIIDGVPFEQGNDATNRLTSAANLGSAGGGLSPLNMINPQEIEHIEILKDADATAIYGSRGANGVVLITTKRSNGQQTRYNITAHTGHSRVGRTMPMLDTETFLAMRREAFKNDGATMNLANAPDVLLWDNNRYTDFKKELVGHNASDNRLQLAISGGNAQTNFRIGAGYFRQTSVFSPDFANQIGSLNFSIAHRSHDQKLALQFSGSYARDNNRLPSNDPSRYLALPPNIRLYNDDGSYAWADGGIVYNTLGSDIVNPFALREERFRSLSQNLIGNLVLDYMPIKSLKLSLNLGYNSLVTNEYSSKPTAAIDPNLTVLFGIMPSASFANTSLGSYIAEPKANYDWNHGHHHISFLLGGVWQHKGQALSYQYGANYNSDLLLETITAAGTVTASNEESVYRYSALFSRFNYNYADRYIINFTARRDGSSRFGPNRRMANFSAIGFAWLFADEGLVRRNLPWLSSGKIRTSYGVTGNDQIGEYKYLNLWSATNNSYDGTPGLYPRSVFNANYNWERIRKWELGLNLGFFKDRLMLEAAYYVHRSGNQLINYNLPAQTGFSQVVMNFPALVQNKGLELMLNGKWIRNKMLTWSTSFNISFNRNKLLKFPDIESSSYRNTYIVGKSLNLIQGLSYLGVDPLTGIYKFRDVNGDGLLNTADYGYIGERSPKYTGGMQQNLSYRGFELNFFFQFTKQLGLSYIHQLSSSVPGRIYNQPIIVLQRWQSAGDIANIQRFTAQSGAVAGALSYLRQSDGSYADASFIKLRNVDFSYTFKEMRFGGMSLGGLKIYMQAQNLFTITNYLGADPETQNFYKLSPLRTMAFGIQLNM